MNVCNVNEVITDVITEDITGVVTGAVTDIITNTAKPITEVVGIKVIFNLTDNFKTGSEFRALVAKALSVEAGVMNEKPVLDLFNYTITGGNPVPANSFSAYQFGPGFIAACGQVAALNLIQLSYQINQSLSRLLKKDIGYSTNTDNLSVRKSAMKVYTVKSLVVTKKSGQYQRYRSLNAKEKIDFVKKQLVIGLQRQADQYRIQLPDGALDNLKVASISDVGCPILIKKNKQGKPFWAYSIDTVRFVLPLHLTGSWRAGSLTARGCGNIGFYRPVGTDTIDASSAVDMLDQLNQTELDQESQEG